MMKPAKNGMLMSSAWLKGGTPKEAARSKIP